MTVVKHTAGHDALGSFAPKFAELNDSVLFGEVWARDPQLSPRDRSLITVASLMTQGIFDGSLAFHLAKAKENGVAREEIAEALTHLAFYSGWPKAWAAFRLAKEIWTDDADAAKPSGIFPLGGPNDAYAEYFSGRSYLNQITSDGVPIFNVTFEPGCRTNWHVHEAAKGGGQILLCMSGRGWYQEWDREAQALLPGAAVAISAGVKHWHGAVRDSWFSHLAVEVPGESTSNEWREPVTDEEYDSLG